MSPSRGIVSPTAFGDIRELSESDCSELRMSAGFVLTARGALGPLAFLA